MVDSKVLRLRTVCQQVGLSRATVYRLVRAGQFPRPIQLSKRCVGWRAREVLDWLEERSVSR